MSETVTLSKIALIQLFSQLGYPRDDTVPRHAGPWGPGGPISGGQLGDLARVWGAPTTPSPDPRRFAALARGVAGRLVELQDIAVSAGNANGAQATSKFVMDVGDWVCGNDLRRLLIHFYHWPDPPPDPWPIDQVDPIELIAFGTQFLQAAKVLEGSPLAAAFADAGGRIVKTGIEGLEQSAG